MSRGTVPPPASPIRMIITPSQPIMVLLFPNDDIFTIASYVTSLKTLSGVMGTLKNELLKYAARMIRTGFLIT